MTDDDRADIIFELHLAEGQDARNTALVRLVREHPDLREDLIDHYVEIVLMGWWAVNEPPCPPVDEAEAALSLARFRELRETLAAQCEPGRRA